MNDQTVFFRHLIHVLKYSVRGRALAFRRTVWVRFQVDAPDQRPYRVKRTVLFRAPD